MIIEENDDVLPDKAENNLLNQEACEDNDTIEDFDVDDHGDGDDANDENDEGVGARTDGNTEEVLLR